MLIYMVSDTYFVIHHHYYINSVQHSSCSYTHTQLPGDSAKASRKSELKLFLLHCYYVLVALFFLACFCYLFWRSESYRASLQEYFSCERSGVPPSGEECSKSEIQGRAFPTVVTIVFGLLLMFPVANLAYLVDINELRGLWQTLQTMKSGQPTGQSSPTRS